MTRATITQIQELTVDELDSVSGGIYGIAVALGTAAASAFGTGVSAGYALGMELWGPKKACK